MKKKLCLGLLILLMLTSGCTLFRPGPDKTAATYLDALKEGKYALMYQTLSDAARAKVTEADFVNRYQTIYGQIGVKSVNLEIVKRTRRWKVKDNRTNIPLIGTLSTWTVGEIAVNQTMHMVYEKKTWHIDWQPGNILPQMADLNYRVVVKRTEAERGSIFDRNGEIIAGIGTVYRIGVVPGKITNLAATSASLEKLLNLESGSIEKKLAQKWIKPEHFVPLRYITRDEWQVRKAQLLAIPGVIVSTDMGRTYTQVNSIAPLVGYIGEISAEEASEQKQAGYRAGDLIGRDGLEKRFEKELAGRAGFAISIVDQNGEEQAMLQATQPERGQDLTLTIDLRLERVIEKAMGQRHGVAIALNPKTSEILAMSSFPGYDNSEFVYGGGSKSLKAILTDPATPLLNRPLRGKYIPGSTLKPFTALAALETDPEYDPLKEVNLPESTWKGDDTWGEYSVKRVPRPLVPVDLYGAMKWSDNIYFAQLSYKLGSDRLYEMADRAGFGREIPFVLTVAKSSLAKERPITRTRLLADTGYGQGQVLMTPLHIAMLYAAYATDGKLRVPNLLTGEQEKIWLEEPLATPEHLALLKDVLKVTVQDKRAFARVANIPGLDMAGKTGTAQTGNNRETGWFVSFHPAADPEMVLLICVENAVHGSHDALDLTKTILSEYYELK